MTYPAIEDLFATLEKYKDDLNAERCKIGADDWQIALRAKIAEGEMRALLERVKELEWMQSASDHLNEKLQFTNCPYCGMSVIKQDLTLSEKQNDPAE
jgi:hypothetical protein